jgi:hypothetical protein
LPTPTNPTLSSNQSPLRTTPLEGEARAFDFSAEAFGTEEQTKIPLAGPSIILEQHPRKLICGRFGKPVHRQLRKIAFDEDSTVQALMAEAINLLFATRSLPKIAKS